MAKTRRRKKRTHRAEAIDPAKKGEPKTFVFRRGKHGVIMGDLEKDIRKMMLPNTALNLRESKRNTIKDFVSVGGPMGVTHFIVLTATENACYMKAAKTPRGPTITMKISEYSLIRDVQSALARPRVPQNAFKTAPLVVMNNFGTEEHMRLATVLFQNMFPAINVHKTRLGACQRVVMLNNNKETGRISLRHYSIGVAPSGLKKNVKKLLQHKDVPDLGHMQDVSEYITRSGYGSESEGEDAEASRVTLAQDMGHGNVASRQSRVRLYEIGPRLELEIMKVEEGLCEGKVLYHKLVERTGAEISEQQRAHEEKAREKAERRRVQEQNVKKKRLEAARKEFEKAEPGKLRRGQLPGVKSWWEQELEEAERENQQQDDDDEQYFREEVGRAPDDGDMIQSGDGRGRGRRGGRFSRGRGRGAGTGERRFADEFTPRSTGTGDAVGDGGGGASGDGAQPERLWGRSGGRGRGRGGRGTGERGGGGGRSRGRGMGFTGRGESRGGGDDRKRRGGGGGAAMVGLRGRGEAVECYAMCSNCLLSACAPVVPVGS